MLSGSELLHVKSIQKSVFIFLFSSFEKKQTNSIFQDCDCFQTSPINNSTAQLHLWLRWRSRAVMDVSNTKPQTSVTSGGVWFVADDISCGVSVRKKKKKAPAPSSLPGYRIWHNVCWYKKPGPLLSALHLYVWRPLKGRRLLLLLLLLLDPAGVYVRYETLTEGERQRERDRGQDGHPGRIRRNGDFRRSKQHRGVPDLLRPLAAL